jgi:hypothetical protein
MKRKGGMYLVLSVQFEMSVVSSSEERMLPNLAAM